MRLKGKAGDLGGARSGTASEDRGRALRGRWSGEEERKEEAGHRRVGSGCQRKRGGERRLR
jgi:hypothetical protein